MRALPRHWAAIAVRLLAILATFALSVVVSRLLGASTAGEFFLVFTIVAIAATLGRLGTDNLSLRKLSGESERPAHDARALVRIAAVCSILVAFAFIPVIYLALRGVDILAVAAISSMVIAQAVAVVAGSQLRALGRVVLGALAELGSIPAITTVVLLVWAQFVPTVTLAHALFVFGGASWLTAAWSIVALARTMPTSAQPDVVGAGSARAFFKSHVGKLAHMAVTSVAAYGMVWAPVFALGFSGDPASVAFYTVAARLANFASLVPTVQIAYLGPLFARLYFAHEIDELNAHAGRSVRQVGVATLVPTVMLVLFSDEIMTLLYGPEFEPAAPILAVLALGVFLTMMLGQVNQLMLLCELERAAMLLALMAIVAWASLGVVLAIFADVVWVAAFGSVVAILYAAAGAMMLARARSIRPWLRLR